jgi:hypothetical protein
MAYEKALSLISGGGKTLETENDENFGFVIKAKPEEMEAGAIAVKRTDGAETAYVCMRTKPASGFEQASAVFLHVSEEDGTLKRELFQYNNTVNGYTGNGSDQPVG